MTRLARPASAVLAGGVSRHSHKPYAVEPDVVVIDIAPAGVDLLSARSVLANAAPLTLIAPISWRILAESIIGLTVELRFHRADDDSVDVSVIHFGADNGITVLSKACPSPHDMREMRADIERYSRRETALYLEAR